MFDKTYKYEYSELLPFYARRFKYKIYHYLYNENIIITIAIQYDRYASIGKCSYLMNSLQVNKTYSLLNEYYKDLFDKRNLLQIHCCLRYKKMHLNENELESWLILNIYRCSECQKRPQYSSGKCH